MSTVKTTEATAQDNRAISREVHPSARKLQQPVFIARFNLTQTAALVAADVVKLGSLQIDGAVILPELCSVIGSSASAKFIPKIQSVTDDAAAVDESGSPTHDGSSAKRTAFTRTSAGTNTVLDAASYLQVLISTTSGFNGGAAGDTLVFEVAYRIEKHVG